MGDIIYPLNQLKEKFPDIYSQQYAKYDDISEKDVEIPGFGFWNDCINLMPVNPGLVKAELEKYWHDTNWEWNFYKIDSENLNNSKLVIMTMTDSKGIFERKFIKFSKETFDKYCHIGEATRVCFQKAKDNGEQPNTFARIPHVLYRDSFKTSDFDIIKF